MKATAKLFQHGGSQAVRLPKAFRFENSSEVLIERRGDEVILKAAVSPKLKTLEDVARHMREHFPQGAGFPEVERPTEPQARDLDLD